CSEGLTADAASALELRGRQFNEVVVGHCYLLNYPALRLPIDSCKRSIIHPDDRDAVEVKVARAIAQRQPFYAEYRCLTTSGDIRWLSDQGQGYWDAAGNLLCLDGVLLDISDRKRAEERLKILSKACEQSPTSIIITDAQGNIEYVNSRFETVTGYSLDEVRGRNPRLLQSGHTPPELYRQLWSTIKSGQAWYGEFHNRTKTGELFWEKAAVSPIKDSQGGITHYIGVKEDITLHKETAEMLAYQTNFDLLTALPNRALAFDRLRQALRQAEKDQEYVALLLVDLDNFKTINETLGHDAGDTLLTEAAQRLQNCLCKSDTAARLGGDEFLLLLPGLSDLAAAGQIAQQVLTRLEQPYYLGVEECFLSASIGIVTYPTDGDSPGVLLRNAEIALYNAKNTGRNTFKFFESGMNQAAQRRRLITSCLRHAQDNQEFHLVYQPFVDLAQGHTVGAEALLRWTSPELGEISPVEFIPIAEETGLISTIGEWVIQQACQEAGSWPTVHGQNLRVAVNLSPRQFRTTQLLTTIITALQASKISPTCLELEITERLLLDDLPATKELMKQFQAMQIRLSIDDFGTGYSALSYLKKFPLNVLKIDRSFVTDLPSNPELMTLVKAIIGMAHELGLKVIAEGVETAEQLAILRAYGCDYGQGYFFSPALQPEAFRAYLLKAGRSEVSSAQALPTCQKI
ncbi:MAG TPA: EAL domain-containing protein, partial [Leptolyngbyaceae cyanobacterium]